MTTPLISPSALSFSIGAGIWNNVILGIIIALLALANVTAKTVKQSIARADGS